MAPIAQQPNQSSSSSSPNGKAGVPAAASRERFQLRAIERTMTMSDAASFQIAHTMHVRGQIGELLLQLPMALMMTFNKHPKMRVKQVKGEFATAEIYPLLQLADITTEDLLFIKGTDAQGLRDDAWHAFMQEQVHRGFDRFTQFPFCLHVWVDTANDQARLFLFSDHYLSDGSSGNTVLNDILTFAAALSCDETVSNQLTEELPVRPSLYNITLYNRPFASPMLRFAMKYGVRMLLKAAPKFTQLLPARDDQQDFRMPNAPNNASTMLFAHGSRENLTKLIAKCREEGTTFFGALTAAILLSYIVTTDSVDSEAFKIFVLANFNLRSRASQPVEPETVGSYATASLMDKLVNSGINVTSARFWDLARDVKQQTVSMLESFPMLALPMVMLDQNYHAEANGSLFEEFPIKNSNIAELNVSSVGKFPHTRRHTFGKGELSIESLHYNCRTPFLATACQFYVTSLDAVGYSCSHHYEDAVGKSLFEMAVTIMEQSWRITSEDTLVDAIGKLVENKEGNQEGNQEEAPMA